MRAVEIRVRLLDEVRGPEAELHAGRSIAQLPSMDDAMFMTYVDHEIRRLIVSLMRADLDERAQRGEFMTQQQLYEERQRIDELTRLAP